MKKILLDTNAYARYLTGDETIFTSLGQADAVYMSIFVLGELYAGFKGGSKEVENIEILSQFLSKPTVSVLKATQETAEIFGMVKDNLKKAGTPLPINDVWIASHTIETGSTVITYDRHFKKIAGLRIWHHI